MQGHVDTIATIISVTPDGNALTFRLRPREQDVLKYIVEKGYVTLDGASLTITKVEDMDIDDEGRGWWEVMLIAYTQDRVVMGGKSVGDEVNVEVDMVGKYVQKSVMNYFEGQNRGEPAVFETMVKRIIDKQRSTEGAESANVGVLPGK